MTKPNKKTNNTYIVFKTEIVKEFESYKELEKYMNTLDDLEYAKHLFQKKTIE